MDTPGLLLDLQKQGNIVRVEKLGDMLALFNRKLPDNAISFQQLFDEWKQFSKEQTGDTRERLTLALAARKLHRVAVDGHGFLLRHLPPPGKSPSCLIRWLRQLAETEGAAVAETVRPDRPGVIAARGVSGPVAPFDSPGMRREPDEALSKSTNAEDRRIAPTRQR